MWLLRGLTAALPPGTAARAWDEDGEFVLIEAAESLPRWLRPETAADRVWWCGGALHIVPPPATPSSRGTAKRRLPAGAPAQPTAAQALAFVRDLGVRTEAGPKVVAALAGRLEGAPGRAGRQGHTARLAVPAPLAGVLVAAPRLLAAATAAFVGADARARAMAARAGAAALFGGACGPSPPLATVTARFSRLQFAQFALAPAGLTPPGWPTPSADAPREVAAALELGAKVAAAFALLVADGERLVGAGGGTSLPADPAALAALPEWRAYLAALTSRGAFDGEVEGSSRWREVLAAAAREFAGSAAWRAAAAARSAPSVRVRALLAAPTPDVAALEAACAHTPVDSDAWMRDGGAELEEEVERLERGAAAAAEAKAARKKEGGGGGGGGGAPPPPPSSAFDPSAVVAQVQAFVNKISSFEGAEVPQAAEAAAGASASGGGLPAAAPTPPQPRGLSLDGTDFWRELGACLGVAPDDLFGGGEGGGGGQGAAAINALFGSDGEEDEDDEDGTTSEEGSSFYGVGEDEEGSGMEEEEEDVSSDEGSEEGARPPSRSKPSAAALAAERARLAALERGGRSVRAGPPPEGEGTARAARPAETTAPFAPAYAAALDAQLAGTTLAATFAGGDEDGGRQAQPRPRAGGPIVPVDVDANLVASLLASHAGGGGGGGLPGPAAGLAAMLGVRLPAAPPPPLPEPAPAPVPAVAPPPPTPNSSRG